MAAPTPPRRNTLRTSALVVGAWLVVGLLTTHSTYVFMRRTGAPAEWMSIFTLNLVSVMLWAAFTPAIVWIARRVPFRRDDLPRATAAHVMACVGLALADVMLEQLLLQAFALTPPNRADLVAIFLRRLFPNSLCYISVASISMVLDYARAAREREQREVLLSAQLAAARLQALHAQLRPHFLFNTLSMIAEQVHANPAAADRMIGRLSHLLRASLSSRGHHEVTLVEEREALQAYLDIMDLRLSGRARVRMNIPEALERALVPTLLLQPLAENAYRHGIEPLARDAELSIAARREGDVLEVTVTDNGRGFDPNGYSEGVGLRVVRERLAQLYGNRAELRLQPRPGGGTIATVRLPFHLDGAERDAVESIALEIT